MSPSRTIELFTGRDEQFYFRMVAPNGETVMSSEGYVSRASRDEAVNREFPDLETVEVETEGGEQT